MGVRAAYTLIDEPTLDRLMSLSPDALPAIIEALTGADFTAFEAARIFPRVWSDEPGTLRTELADAFEALRAVHRQAAEAGRHLVISIY